MDAFRARIANALSTAGCPLSPDQLVALNGALIDAAQDDEGMPMVAAIMTQYDAELQRVREDAVRREQQLRTALRAS